MEHQMTEANIRDFQKYLYEEECSGGTVEKYIRDVRNFQRWASGRAIQRETASGWKNHLLEAGYTSTTINSMVSAVNRFFRFMGWEECRVKFLQIQRKVFRDQTRELNENEYKKLLAAAAGEGKERLALLMETIGSTGIRVSETMYITVEAVKRGRAEISLKRKVRIILLPKKLCRKLLRYAKRQNIVTGAIFLTKNGSCLSRRQIWYEMKRLCQDAGVEETKVFPHNLRHLFAVTFHRVCNDLVKLADILGHSSIETTRIYLISTGKEHAAQIERMGLVV